MSDTIKAPSKWVHVKQGPTTSVYFFKAGDNGAEKFNEEAAIEALEDALNVDDVVITKVQLFEGVDEDEAN